MEPLVVSWGWNSERPGSSKFIDQHEWWGTRDIAPFLSVPAAIQFQEVNDWDAVRAGCHALAVEAETQICKLTGLPSQYSDDSWYAQMVAVPLPAETDIVALKSQLYDGHRIEVPLVKWNGRKLIRVSVQGYNTGEDISTFVLALREFFKKYPAIINSSQVFYFQFNRGSSGALTLLSPDSLNSIVNIWR